MQATERHITFDIAKGGTVFIMPAVHSVLLYSTGAVKQSWLGAILGFMAEGPGAQLFMLLMGMAITFGKPKSVLQIVKRFLLLFIAGLLLNFLRLVLPFWFEIIPDELLQDLGINDNAGILLTTSLKLLALGDILQFAAIAYLSCAIVSKFRSFQFLAMAFVALIAFASPLVWDIHCSNSSFNYLLLLLAGKPPEVFFPAFPWLVYPLAGLILGYYYNRINKNIFYNMASVAGISLFALGYLLMQFEPANWHTDFYRATPGDTFRHLGIVLMWLKLCHWIVRFFWPNPILKFLSWLSKHITIIYFIQWVLVLWMLPVFGYHHNGLFASLLIITNTTVLTFILTDFVDQLFFNHKNTCYEKDNL